MGEISVCWEVWLRVDYNQRGSEFGGGAGVFWIVGGGFGLMFGNRDGEFADRRRSSEG